MNPRLAFIVPGDPTQRTGGYLYDAHIVDELRALGWTVDVHGLPGRFPHADATARSALRQTLQALPADHTVVLDGLALGGLPEVAIEQCRRLRLVALVHHPLADESGIDPATRRCLLASERAALAAVHRVITTSAFTARRIAEFGLRAGRIRVVEPGVGALPEAAAEGDPPRLLCVGSLAPRKGQDLLVRALVRLHALPWQCELIGSTQRAPAYAQAVERRVAAAGLGHRIQLRGECNDETLHQAYAAADLFVLPSLYEGYGMVVSEAVAAGLPILTTTGGALAETLPAAAGVAVPPGDVEALTHALDALITDRERRLRLRDGARLARASLRSWPQAGAEFAHALAGVGDPPPSSP